MSQWKPNSSQPMDVFATYANDRLDAADEALSAVVVDDELANLDAEIEHLRFLEPVSEDAEIQRQQTLRSALSAREGLVGRIARDAR